MIDPALAALAECFALGAIRERKRIAPALAALAECYARLGAIRERKRIAWYLSRSAAFDDTNHDEMLLCFDLSAAIARGDHDADCDRYLDDDGDPKAGGPVHPADATDD